MRNLDGDSQQHGAWVGPEMQMSLRSLTQKLHPARLERLGLAETLKSFAASLPLPCTLEIGQTWTDPILPEAVHLMRMTQEICGNTLKHANASRIEILLDLKSGHRILVVRDNGIGFRSSTPQGMGLPGLYERAALLEGDLELQTSPGEGCVWRLTMPA